jgi:hypothetical protein
LCPYHSPDLGLKRPQNTTSGAGTKHYPSDVTADGGGPVYYQQQVLATMPRSDFGAGF